MRPDAVTKALARIAKREFPDVALIGPHDLRRTAATRMGKMGISTDDRGYVLNHVSGAKSNVTSWNYDADSHNEQKQRALEAWERELLRVIENKPGHNIVTLRRA